MDTDLLELVNHAPAVDFTASCTRAYRADRNPLSGTGAALRGGRYNVRGIETLYLGKPADVALAEVRHAFAQQELQIPPNRYVTQTLDVAFNKVLDLTRAEIRDVIGINEDELAANEHGRLPQLGEAAHYLGFHAIVAPSARTEGSNIAVYLTHAAAHVNLRDDRRYFT